MPLLIRALLTIFTTFACTAAAQQQMSHEQNITLDVITTPATENLQPQDFQLLDNNVPRAITSVRRVSSGAEPAHVIVVVDAVNVPFTRTAYVRSQVQKYLQKDGGHLANPTTFAVVTDKTTEVQKGFSNDGNALSSALAQYPISLREVRRDQGFWGADERTQISLQALSQLIDYAAKIPGPKMVLWISPGWPLLSGARIDLSTRQHQNIFNSVVAYSRQFRTANITLYNINPIGPEEDLLRADYYQGFLKGITKPEDTDVADLSLQVLAVQSGGLTITSNSDVAGNISRCLDDARSLYEVTFVAPKAEHANEYHHLQVRIAKPGISARTRDGYYAQP